MPLNNIQVKSAKAREKPYKLFDGQGMYVLVHPSGGKYWRLKYRIGGREKVLALGVYPEVSLSNARKKREHARELRSKGKDPSVAKKLWKIKQRQGEANSFEAVAREWHDKQKTILFDRTARDNLSKLINHVFPYIGVQELNKIPVPDLLEVLKRLENEGKVSTAKRTKQIIERVFRYAIVTGRASYNPIADLKGALIPEVPTHHASITNPLELGKLLRDIDAYSGTFPVLCALKLAPLLFVRPGELRRAQWKDIDFENRQWIIPKEVMKKVGRERRDHLVPLSSQALEILSELKAVTGDGDYVFSSQNKPMSENTINSALRRLGYSGREVVGHGFRTTASTMLHEQGYLSDAIERQLAHVESNDVKRAYNKAKHLEVRTKMMQGWSDYLFGLKADNAGKIISMKQA